jgi:hypothetical protein
MDFIYNKRCSALKILVLAICLGIVFGAAVTVGIHLYFDAISFLYVLSAAIGFLVVKNNPEKHSKNFGLGAAYFGCLGTLVSLVAIIGDRFLVWDEIKKGGFGFSCVYACNFICLLNKICNFSVHRSLKHNVMVIS